MCKILPYSDIDSQYQMVALLHGRFARDTELEKEFFAKRFRAKAALIPDHLLGNPQDVRDGLWCKPKFHG